MGGRGASSSRGGGGGGGAGVLGAQKATINGTPNMYGSSLNLTADQIKNDYTDGGNPNLIKFQGQTEDKTARYLAKTWNDRDFQKVQQQTNDPYPFYDNPLQATILDMGLNKPATVLSESDFNKYVQNTNATVLFRGVSGQNAVDRLKTSPNNHTGNGINGDGYYFSASKSTAQGYGSTGIKAALSPNARVVSVNTVNAEIAKMTPNFQSSLAKAGSLGTRTFGPNSGQAQMALKMGYNTIDAGWAVIPLTRDAIVVSNKNAW